MKRHVLGIMVLSVMGLAANAQQNLSFGPTAGFGHTWMSNSPNSKYQPAGNVGVALTYSSSPHLGFGTEVKYSIEGGRVANSNDEITTRLNYIRIPLKVIYFFGEFGDRVRPKIAVGPSFGFLTGGKIEHNDVESPIDVKDVYKSVDAGLTASVGVNYRLVKNTWFVADVNYYNGFTNINEAANLKAKNRNLGLNIGVNFGIGTAK